MTLPDSLRTPQEACKILGVATPTLARWRCQGSGPSYIKIGHRVAYTDADLASWLESQRRTFTGQNAGAAPALMAGA